MLTFYPEFEDDAAAVHHEVVFLLDLSNSMKGASLVDAKKLLLLLLRHLPSTCLFNVVAFGSRCRELFVVSQCKDNMTTQQAEDFLQRCQADMGNTVLHR